MSVENNLPKGWVETTLGEVCDVQSGGTPSTKIDSYWNGNIGWITPKDLSNYKRVFIKKGERSITKAGLDNSSAKLLPKHTVLFSSRAPIGYVVIADNEIATNQGFKNIICDEEKSHYRYFYYLLKLKASYIESLSSGSTFSEASGSLMKSIEVSIPDSLQEQKAIASILTTFDDKIELLQAQNETLETIAQTIFKEWFGKYQVGDELPKGWRVENLGNVSLLSAGGDKPINVSLTSNEINNIPIYSNGITADGLYGYTDTPKVTEECITVSARGTIGFVCLRTKPFVPIVRLVTVIPKKNCLTSKYLFFWLKNANIDGTGTTQQQLTVPDFKRTEIIIPRFELINKFTTVVDSFYDKIEVNNSQIQILQQTRDTLLPKLMSGKVRVDEFKE